MPANTGGWIISLRNIGKDIIFQANPRNVTKRRRNDTIIEWRSSERLDREFLN